MNQKVNSTALRTHLCGDMRAENIGQTVTLCGWVGRRREHGEHLAFLDLRDFSGIVHIIRIEMCSCCDDLRCVFIVRDDYLLAGIWIPKMSVVPFWFSVGWSVG